MLPPLSFLLLSLVLLTLVDLQQGSAACFCHRITRKYLGLKRPHVHTLVVPNESSEVNLTITFFSRVYGETTSATTARQKRGRFEYMNNKLLHVQNHFNDLTNSLGKYINTRGWLSRTHLSNI